jgi:hypothetical protein
MLMNSCFDGQNRGRRNNPKPGSGTTTIKKNKSARLRGSQVGLTPLSEDYERAHPDAPLMVRQPLFATLARIAPARVIMAQERELVPPQGLQAEQRRVDERWPVPHAILFITVVSVTLWSLIIVAARWLIA